MFARSIRQAVVGLVASGVVAGVLSAGTAQAAEARANEVYTFVPLSLTVHDIEDSWPDWKDEPRMYYGGAVWADVVSRGGYGGHIPAVDFTGSTMRVDLWERDNDWNDSNYLGGETVASHNLDEERTLRFKSGWFDYELTYKVIARG